MNAAKMTEKRSDRGGAGKPKSDSRESRKAARSGDNRHRYLGNSYMQGREERTPSIRIKGFNRNSAFGTHSASPDKGEEESNGAQDQHASLTSFATEARGVGIEVEAVDVYSSTEYPDGFRWTQTIDTNVPLGGTTSPYVDPRPNDDTKPFYWTDAEYAARPTTFIDHPSRNPPSSGTTTWQAVLSLNGVNGTTATRFDSLTYGFSVDTSGTVTANSPQSPGAGDVTTHQNTLASEFSSWTFN